MVRAERAAVGVEYVLGVGGFDLERVEAEVISSSLPLVLKPCASIIGGDKSRCYIPTIPAYPLATF